MRTWDYIDSDRLPGEDRVIYLCQRGSEYAIHVEGRELMGSAQHGSEDALADLACDRLADLSNARILVGGLGMGFTLAAALRRCSTAARVTVAELVPSVVRWNQELVGQAAGHPLSDPRTDVHVGDVADLIDGVERRWSAILLDVDNGPQALTRPTNAWMYTRHGLVAAHRALIDGGVLAIWSVLDDPPLTRRLRRAGFEVECIDYVDERRATRDENGTHSMWFARRT